MTPKATLLYTILLAFAIRSTPASAAQLVLMDNVDAGPMPTAASCPDYSGYYQAPDRSELLDCANIWCTRLGADRPDPCQDPNCARLNKTLRAAAITGNAREMLVSAALYFYWLRHSSLYSGNPYPWPNGSRYYGQALADLAVTGRKAYENFRTLAPNQASLSADLQTRLLATFSSHVPVPSDVSAAVRETLDRSYGVAWALRGPTPHRNTARDALGWIAVSGEDDPPHRPVNIRPAPFPQYNMDVPVGGKTVTTRYVVYSSVSKGGITDNHPVPGDLHTIPPDRDRPLIVGDVVIFIGGHSSSAEEAESIAVPLFNQATRERPVTVIAMDLPTNGYASMIDHETISPSINSKWNTGYPILSFIENFIVAFVDELEARQPGIKHQIVGVIGGSLGGNMGLRLARREPVTHPWLRNVVSWSPASCWDSWGRYSPWRWPSLSEGPCIPFCAGTAKWLSVDQSFDFMQEPENPEASLHNLFHGKKAGQQYGRVKQSEHWYSATFPCKDTAIDQGHRFLYEIYNDRFRRWHWRVGHEQLIYSHWDSENPSSAIDPDPQRNPAAGPARYSQIRARMLFATGYNDNNWPEYLFKNAKLLASSMLTVDGVAYFVTDAAHSIHAEKPDWFAARILEFLYQSPPPPFPAWLVVASTF